MTVLVSWALALLVPRTIVGLSFSGETGARWFVTGEHRTGATFVTISAVGHDRNADRPFWVYPLPASAQFNPLRAVPYWSWANTRSPLQVAHNDPKGAESVSIDEHATGWPWLAMVARTPWVQHAHLLGSPDTGISLHKLGIAGAEAVLPIRPIWPGFAANSVIFACTAWLCSLAIGSRRRTLRARRGRCPTCAYDLAGLPTPHCPECGAPPPTP